MKYLILIIFLTGCSANFSLAPQGQPGLTKQQSDQLSEVLTKQQQQLDALGKAVIALQEK